ncbi:MAG TPA: pilus assembly protein PilM [Candidatus Acidoferrales bacterium]|nr:pilus assembly protein PilM [Candidatus Acidoferrales bacterium]
MKRRSLPLGIDLGAARIRIAEMWSHESAPTLERVITIDLEDARPGPHDERYLGSRIATSLRELGVRERRCVIAVAEPDATMRTVTFPPMGPRERERAGLFEASRHIDYPLSEASVKTAAIDPQQGLFALGIVRSAAMQRRLQVLRFAGLRPITVDHEAYALKRAFPYADAVLDIGYLLGRFYAYGAGAPVGIVLDGGADTFTQAIARGLSIDVPTAERRKRTIGLSGVAENEMNAFTYSVGRALLTARNQGVTGIQRLVVTGNGARLPSLAERLERDTGCSVDIAADLGVESSSYPEDITRASAPDWALSVGLALWTCAGERAA